MYFFPAALNSRCLVSSLSAFVCILDIVFEKLFVEIVWSPRWCYFPPERIPICFCQMPRGTSNFDHLCPISGIAGIRRWPAVPVAVHVLSGHTDFRVQTFGDPTQSKEEWPMPPPAPDFLGGSQTPVSVPLAPPGWLNYCLTSQPLTCPSRTIKHSQE